MLPKALLHTTLVAAVMWASTATSAAAGTYSYTKDTTGKPTYNRLVAPGTNLSLVGTHVAYDVLEFTVSQSGNYSFLSTANYDNYTFLYKDAFNPAAPKSNLVIGNDDFPTIKTSGFAIGLSSGVLYFFVNTGFTNADQGAFAATITGAGAVSAVPEPAAYAMLCMGLAGIVLRGRRRPG